MLPDVIDNLLSPPGYVALPPEIAQRPLWRPNPVLELGDLVAERDKELPVALSLVKGQHEDTAEIPTLLAILLPGKVADEVMAVLVDFCDEKEDEGEDVEGDVFVVQEELREVGKVLAIGLVLNAIDFKHRNILMPIDLVPGRMRQLALL